MPHESTVTHEQRFVLESPMISRSRTFAILEDQQEETAAKPDHKVCPFLALMFSNFKFLLQPLERSLSQIPHARPATPRSVTHNHDEDYSDEESSEDKNHP